MTQKLTYEELEQRVKVLEKESGELIRAKEELKRYQLIIESAHDAIFFKDLESRYITANKKTLDAFGLPKENVIGKNDYELLSDLKEAQENVYDDQSVFESRNSKEIIKHMTGADGKEYWFQAIKVPQFDNDGKVIGLVGIARDISERKRAEEEKKKLEAQLRQAQKMEAVGALAGGIAHDFNNILSPIMLQTEMVMMELPSGSPLLQNMAQIYKASQRARDLVKQVLRFARKEKKVLIPIKISRIMKEALKLLRSTLPTTIDIQCDINSQQDTVLADPTEIDQILMNLCTNASNAMEENGGVLEVGLRNVECRMHVNTSEVDEKALVNLEPGRYLRLTVRDTGYGIEPQFMDKIFDPYFTTKEVGKGTGMGLALVHSIVQSYSGAITVHSEVGKGTSFHVYLPLVERDLDDLDKAKDSGQFPKGTERILFVDDEEDVVDSIQQMLEKLGYKVTVRISSIEALEAFRHKAEAFDLVITDQTMPNMTGNALAKELMSIRPDIPIILCTGFSEEIDERKAKEMGISAFVMKPIMIKDLANIIREVLNKK